MKDYYQILGIEIGASEIDVKKAYRKFALKFHPDRNKDANAAEMFIKATEAYEVLRDPIKRLEYNKLYKAYYSKTETQKEQQYQSNYKEYYQEWESFGRQKAQEYSSIPFEEFARRLLKEVSIGAGYLPNLIAILFVGGGAIGMLTIIPDAFDDGGGLGIFILLTVFRVIIFGY